MPGSQRLVVARVGWMRFYRGVQADDRAPRGGGSYNREKTGLETCNFLNLNGVVRGYAAPGRLNLRRIDPDAKDDRLEHVTVVFVAPDARKFRRGPRRGQARGGQKVIGWYSNATVFALPQKETDPVRKKHADAYLFEAKTDDAFLLPEGNRNHAIPKEKGALGTSNITYPLDERGVEKPGRWISDLRQYLEGNATREHVSQGVDDGATDLIATANADEFAARVSRLLRREVLRSPTGEMVPTKVDVSSSRFERRPDVVAWVLRASGGKCEVCGAPAPFQADGHRPFLEVHHVKTLAEGGPDVVENAVAACPNCHRALHFAHDRDARLDDVYVTVQRLRRY